MSNKKSMKDFQPQKDNLILFDTNILIDLFYPMNIGKDISEVSKLYDRIIKVGAKIIITSIQVSEFVNRCIRFQYELYKVEHPECEEFKRDYRGCDDYNECMQVIIDIVKNEWAEKVKYVDDCFSELSKDNILRMNFAYDFNDALVVEIANKYNAIVVTNDRDIISYSVKNLVVSNNQFILKVR